MAKIDDYAKFLIPDPADATRSIFRIDISIANDAINLGGFEIVAKSKGWDPVNIPTQEPNPAIFLDAWVKTQAQQGMLTYADNEAAERRAQVLAQLQDLM